MSYSLLFRVTKVITVVNLPVFAQWEKELVETLVFKGNIDTIGYQNIYTNTSGIEQSVSYTLKCISNVNYVWAYTSDTPNNVASDATTDATMRPKVYYGRTYSETITLLPGHCIGIGRYYADGYVELYVRQ